MRRFVCTLAVGFLILGAVAVPEARAKDVIKFAYFNDPTFEVLTYAIKEGKVTSETIQVEITALDIAALLQATGTRQFDAIETSVLGVPSAKARGLTLLIIGAGVAPRAGFAIFVPKGSPIQRVEDLRGKTIGAPALRSTSVAQMRMVLQSKYKLNAALEKGDVQWVELPLPTLPVVLAQGKVDAAFMFQSPGWAARQSGEFRILVETVEDFVEQFGVSPISSVIVTYPETVRAKPAAMREFIRLVRASLEYARTNAAEVHRVVGQRVRLDPKFLDVLWGQWYGFSARVGERDLASIQKMWEAGKEMGLIPAVIPIKEAIWE